MVVAYALIEAQTGGTTELVEDVEAIDGVEAAHLVAGDVDLIAHIEVDGPGEASTVINREIAALEAVTDTETYMSMGG